MSTTGPDGRSDPATDAAGTGSTAQHPDWLVLEPGESLVWVGGPRIQTVIPAVLVGLAVVAGAVLVPEIPTPFAAVGVLPPVGTYLWLRNTDYVVTDRRLYRKRGVLGRRVTAVGYETVQNAAYSQGVLGTLFDYGAVEFDTAGEAGTELAFRNIDDPRTVKRYTDEQLGRHRRGSDAIPGSLEQWQAVLQEVRALRDAVENRSQQS
jgi:membrane protein YdbS with pleckstrin-like domain